MKNKSVQTTSAKTGANFIPSVFRFLVLCVSLIHLCGCSDFFHPVNSTPEPTEYAYNYWLLDRTYLFEEELSSLEPEGDSVQLLYKNLKDPFTRYVPPSKSESVSTSINTSIVPGDIGLEYYLNSTQTFPLCIKRVYPESPAHKAKVPRYSCIEKINGTDLSASNFENGTQVYYAYNDVLTKNKVIKLQVQYGDSTQTFEMEKADVYAPTIFVDTLYRTIIVTITGFKQTTFDKKGGSFGELKAYLDSTKGLNIPRILDLRGNPGGHVNHCITMADLFIKEGIVSTRSWKSFDGDGNSVTRKASVKATAGDAGEGENFIVLVNGGSASCAEIFTAAVAEGANIPVVGKTTYGKGIGQSTWHTKAGGLAIITNLEFLTPKGNSYNKKGIEPDIDCGDDNLLLCGINALQEKYGTKTSLKKSNILGQKKLSPLEYPSITRGNDSLGGAFIENPKDIFDKF